MKTLAAALLLVSFAVFAATFVPAHGDQGWLGFVRTASEAAMVGGLADWFAVTALFRRPLGLPIPHTALIPRRKDAIGRSLQAFVGENFLTEEAVRRQLVTARVPQRIGGWLAADTHALRVAAEVTSAAATALGTVADSDIRAFAASLWRMRQTGRSLAPVVARVIGPAVRSGGHHQVVDAVAVRVLRWLIDSEDSITALIEEQAPRWTPRFVDRSVARRVYGELVRVVGEIVDDPSHALRQQLDDMLLQYVADLESGRHATGKFDAVVEELLTTQAFTSLLDDLASAGHRVVVEQLQRPGGEFQLRIAAALRRFGDRLQTDEQLLLAIDVRVAGVVGYVLDHFRDEMTRLIADTVERWDATETARRLELQVGRDLQYIRINGTVVGALAGVAIHAVSLVL